MSTNPTVLQDGAQSVADFQLQELSIQEKSQPAYGLKLARHIDGTLSSDYYTQRNARFLKNRKAFRGRIDMKQFQDLLGLNGKKNHVNINWQSVKVVNRIVTGLVGRWMDRHEKLLSTATDTLSVSEKQEILDHVTFYMEQQQVLKELQEKSGVPMLPPGELPKDHDELMIWQPQYQRLPEELLFQQGANDVLAANGLFDVNKEKLLIDASVCGFLGTYTELDPTGAIKVEVIKPENAFYAASEYPDFRDTTFRGRVKGYKISELRRRYGVQFGGKLTEEFIYKELLPLCKEYQGHDRIAPINDNQSDRPYDEWNVECLEFEFKSVDSEPWTKTTTKKNASTILRKGLLPASAKDNQEVLVDTSINIYRGVYVRGTEIMLEWGLKKNMIRPQDPREVGNAEFSYSFYQPQSDGGVNLAIPEKIEKPVFQMILTLLKMEQLIARMRPSGAAINESALNAIDYGLGAANKDVDPKAVYDQTGDLYYRGRDAEGNTIPVPIQELANTGFMGQFSALIEAYRFQFQILQDELGENPNMISQAMQPRVAAGNVEQSVSAGEHATDYIYHGYIRVMEDTGKKIGCLLHDSISAGAKAYRQLLGEEDLRGREFSMKVQLLPDQYDQQRVETFMNNAMASNPQLIMFLDPLRVMRVAREDVKMAELFIRQAQKKMLQFNIQQSSQNAMDNAKVQQESIEAKKKADLEVEQTRREGEAALNQELSNAKKEEIILSGLFGIYQKGLPVPEALKHVESEIINNIAIPLFMKNMAQAEAIKQGVMADEAGVAPAGADVPPPADVQPPQPPTGGMPTGEPQPQMM